MKHHSATETALMVALLMRRSNVGRGRVSVETLLTLSNRDTLRATFVRQLTDALDDIGIAMVQLDQDFALIYVKSLNGAPALTPSRLFTQNLIPKLQDGVTIDFAKIQDMIDTDDRTNAGLEE